MDGEQQKPLGPSVLGAAIEIRGAPQPAPPDFRIPSSSSKILDEISAKSYLVFEEGTDKIIASKDQDLKLGIASLTKLLTALLAYENLDLNSKISIEKQGLTGIKPVVGYVQADQVQLLDVFNSMIVGSTNDSAQILGREIQKVSGKDTVELMNDKARELKMDSSSFSNPIGFDSRMNYSTASDIKKLIQATQKYSSFSNLSRTRSLSFSGSLQKKYSVAATNKLIEKNSDIQAIKTGFTPNSQGSIAVKIIKNGRSFIVIILGSLDREGDVLTIKRFISEDLDWQ